VIVPRYQERRCFPGRLTGIIETMDTQSSHGLRPNLARDAVARLRAHALSQIERSRQERLRKSGEVTLLVTEIARIVFLCYGNIIRSALAERHVKQLLGKNAPVASCGFHLREKRPADPIMAAIAGQNGISLEGWSSRVINRDLVDRSDLIFAMEVNHLMRLFSEYPESQGRAFLLSSVTPPGTMSLEIADPYGGLPSAYEKCFREVCHATSALAELIMAHRRSPANNTADSIPSLD